MKRKLLLVGFALITIIGFTACNNKSKNTNTLTIGASQVPHAEILENIRPDLEKQGVQLEVKVFQDFVLPNKYVAEDQLDGNFFQHIPWMEAVNKERGYDLVNVTGVHIEPMGAYSQKVKNIDALPDGATIALPNGTSEITRALLLLERNKLIQLKKHEGNVTLQDIGTNSKQLKFKPLEPSVLPRIIGEVDMALINTNFALKANLNPLKDALFIEDKASPYVNILVAKKGKEKNQALLKLAELLKSEKTKEFIRKKYNGAIVPAS